MGPTVPLPEKLLDSDSVRPVVGDKSPALEATATVTPSTRVVAGVIVAVAGVGAVRS